MNERLNSATRWLLIPIIVSLVPWIDPTSSSADGDIKTQEKVTFDDHIKPIFTQRCGTCHNSDKRSADLDLSNFTNMMQGGASGEVIEPGDAGNSYLYQLVTHEDSPIMPPGENSKLPKAQLELIAKWINAGALENKGSKARIAKPKVAMTSSGSATTRPENVAVFPRLVLEPTNKTARPPAVPSIATSPWAAITAVAGQKQILLYKNDTHELAGVLPFPTGQPTVLNFSRNGSLLMAAGGCHGAGGKVHVWDVKTGTRILEIGDEIDNVLAADISSDHKMVAMGGPQRMIRVYSTADNSLLYEIKKHTDWVTAIEFSPDGVLLATGDRNGGLHIWEAESGNEYLILKAHSKMITGLSWRLDSNVLASASHDTTIRLWEMENGRQIKNWSAHGNGVTDLEFTRDGHLVSCGRDRVAKLWQQDGKQVRQFSAMADEVLSVSYCDETNKLICGDWSGLVNVFQAGDGSQVAEFSPNPPLLSERMVQAKAQLTTAQTKHVPLAALLTTTVQEIATLVSSIESANQVRTQAESKLNEGNTQLESIQQLFEATNSQQIAWKQELNEKQTARPLIEESRKKAVEAQKTLPGDKEIEIVAKSLANKLVTIDGRIVELNSLVVESDLKKTTTESQITALNQTVDVAKSELTAATTQTQDLEAKKVPLIEQQKQQQTNATSAATEIKNYQNLVAKWNGEIQFKTALDQLSLQLQTATDAANALDVELQTAEQELAEAENRVKHQRETQQSAQQKADAVRLKIHELQGIKNQ